MLGTEVALFEFGTTGGSRFGGPILMDDHVLIREEGPTPGCIEDLGIGVQGVTRRSSSEREDITILVAAR